MVSKDVLVVTAGIAIVAIALIGVFSYEDEYEESETEWTHYTIKYNEMSHELASETGQIGVQDIISHTGSIDVKNLTEVCFEVSWTDRYPGRIRSFSDNFMMEITHPSGTIVDYFVGTPSNSTKSPLIIKANLRETPSGITINTTDQDLINTSLLENTSENGIGKWTANLEVDIQKPLWMVLKNRRDDYTIKITYTHYYATVTTTEVS